MRRFAILVFSGAICLFCGCSQPEFNPTPATSEAGVLSDAVELTHGFARAGEAYFSPDMGWIIFQASMKPDEDYQMYVAQVKWGRGASEPRVEGLLTPIRISPMPSWNSCGYFSPDGESLIFSSTALKPKPQEERGGYQRDKNNYKWEMPTGAEIFRADGWKGAVAAVPAGGSVDLAKHPLTDNNLHDAECSYSADGKWIIFAEKLDEPPLGGMQGATAQGEKREGTPAPQGGTQVGTAAPQLLHEKTAAPTSHPTSETGNVELFVMKADGSKKTRLTYMPGYDGGPFFSPDGKRICYRSDRKGNNLLQVFVADLVFDAAGDITGIKNEKQLTHDANVNWAPFWHPDNKHLIWATTLHGHSNFELYLMRDDGSHKTRITFWNGFDGLPVFSPDGNWMMWTSKRGQEKTSQIWVARFRMPEGS